MGHTNQGSDTTMGANTISHAAAADDIIQVLSGDDAHGMAGDTDHVLNDGDNGGGGGAGITETT